MTYSARILIIEDRPEEIKFLLDVLRNAQFHVSIAFNGMQGYGRAIAQGPDLILLDIDLGQTDGFAICRLLKANPTTSHIPLIFITSAGTLEDKLTGFREGAVDYIVKPFEPAEILMRMRTHLKVPALLLVAAKDGVIEQQHSENSDEVLVKAAVLQIKSNLARMPKVNEIARRVATSEKRLSKAFHHETGQSIPEFARKQRLILARKLLTQTPMTIADIAAETGFPSTWNFSKAFKTTVGLLPTQYRKRQAHLSDPAKAK
jgi:DNA-binding response OmpR family regulator